MYKRIGYVIFILFNVLISSCGVSDEKGASSKDVTHHSAVFGQDKTYRIYLPSGYHQSQEHYPVVYYFHGWGGRHNEGGRSNIDYDKLFEFANASQVILVLWDGRIVDDEPRPYNIGHHRDVKFQVQMKDYFLELVEHIDKSYRTHPHREKRGIIGFSMGGFMSFYLAGKYPQMVGAAVNIVGSQEFFIGYPENHTLYPLAYTFDNLRDVNLLMFNRTRCPMAGLNDEVINAARWHGMQNFECYKTEGEHNIDNPGETSVFESALHFVVKSFEDPIPLRCNWSHFDIYNSFTIRDYTVESNKNVPGFLHFRNVNENGFGFYSRKWLPDGPSLENCQISISTAPIYHPGSVYNIKIFSAEKGNTESTTMIADEKGQLHFEIDGGGFEIGFAKQTDMPAFTALGYGLTRNHSLLPVNSLELLTLKIFNRGGVPGPVKELLVKVSCPDGWVDVISSGQKVLLQPGEDLISLLPFEMICRKMPPTDGSPAWLRLQVEMKYDSLSFSDYLVVPVFFDVPQFEDIRVDDGKNLMQEINSRLFYPLSPDSVFTRGNADGIASPGEAIMLFEGEYPLRLYTSDSFVTASEEKLVDMILKGQWPDGFTHSSVVKISENCPSGHSIEFLAYYETKSFMPMYREVKWGKVKLLIQK